MASYLRVGRASSQGRFPRWGYLDKYFENDRMPRALLVSGAVFLGIVFGWQGYEKFQEWRRGKAERNVAERKKVRVLTPADIGIPPSLTQQQTTTVKLEVKTQPKIALPKPVPDDQAIEETIATTEEMAQAGSQRDLGLGLGAGDSLVIDAGDIGLPSPDEYVAFEKAPDRVSMDDPDYPDLAREAGVEGTVVLRVLVGEDGFIKDMVILQSIQMLDDAAVEAGWTAVFKPALQRDKPIAVWMNMPIEFTLH